MGIGEAEVFSERLKRELQALEAANVHAILEIEPLVDEVRISMRISFCYYHLVFTVKERSGSFLCLFHITIILNGIYKEVLYKVNLFM